MGGVTLVVGIFNCPQQVLAVCFLTCWYQHQAPQQRETSPLPLVCPTHPSLVILIKGCDVAFDYHFSTRKG